MLLASVTSSERGATDRVLRDVVAQLANAGVRVAGALRPAPDGADNGHCDSNLWLLPAGPMVKIQQDLGTGSTACRMDAGAFERAVGMVQARLVTGGADLIVLNKFGVSEAEGRGFRAVIAEAIARDIPVLTGITPAHQAAFDRFADGMATVLPADTRAILDWADAAMRARLPVADGV